MVLAEKIVNRKKK